MCLIEPTFILCTVYDAGANQKSCRVIAALCSVAELRVRMTGTVISRKCDIMGKTAAGKINVSSVMSLTGVYRQGVVICLSLALSHRSIDQKSLCDARFTVR